MMFHAEAQLRLPAGLTPQELRQALERLGSDLMVDITLADAS
jgi:glycine cleavage system regulatory protein